MIDDDRWWRLLNTRATDPGAVRRAYQGRRKRLGMLSAKGTLVLVAADHPARGALGGGGGGPLAMADRRSLLERVLVALDNPEVDGVLGTPDVIEELLLLHGLDDRVVIGSMNRGGLAGADWEIDDRFTAYDPSAIAANGLDGGKMLLRLVDSDPGTVPTLESCAAAVSALAEHALPAMVEPLPYLRDPGGLVLDKDPRALARAAGVAAGLGSTSAYTWLKLPVAPDEVLDATTLPTLVMGGPSDDPAAWSATLRHPTVRGLVIGRSLLYPPDDDVAGAVDDATRLLAESR
ncbi:aldolase [Actinosynnema sp. NPDC020468]|uniref:Cgl0159 family (beta/alpha)8-fold protein n=1 Tax=Actinosynnema sp. NPDC020468 TaxID=3154488 RepID=UPI0033DB6C96